MFGYEKNIFIDSYIVHLYQRRYQWFKTSCWLRLNQSEGEGGPTSTEGFHLKGQSDFHVRCICIEKTIRQIENQCLLHPTAGFQFYCKVVLHWDIPGFIFRTCFLLHILLKRSKLWTFYLFYFTEFVTVCYLCVTVCSCSVKIE